MIKGQIHGPYSGSTSDRAIALIERGIRDRTEIAKGLGISRMDVQHNLRKHVATGLLEFTNDRYEVTPLGTKILEAT